MSAVLTPVPSAGSAVLQAKGPDDNLRADLCEHAVCFVLPVGARMSGDLELPGGALIHGAFSGRIRCAEGTLFLMEGSEFSGRAEAQMVVLAGKVRPVSASEATEIVGHLHVAVSSLACGRANLAARLFSIHSRTFAGTMRTIE